MNDASAETSAQPPATALTPAGAGAAPARPKTPLTLRLIAGFALIKTLLFGGAGLGVAHLLHHDVAETLKDLLRALNLNPDAVYLKKLIARVADVPPHDLALISMVFFIYATLYLAETIGLWLDQTWAEWLTIVTSSLLLPYEIYEMIEKLTLLKTGVFIINVAVVVYLVGRVRRKLRLHHAAKELAKENAAAAAAAAAAGSTSENGAPTE
jgi:uncharacterized membrane protein (DUF2068 family)